MNKNFFLATLILSALLGWATGMIFESSETLQSISLLLKTAFFAVLKMVIGPLIFFSVFSGVLGLGNKASASRIGGVTLVYYLTTTGIAISIGLIVVFFIHPWTSYPPITNNLDEGLTNLSLASPTLISSSDGSITSLFVTMIQRMFVNPISAIADFNILGILTSAVIFGLAATMVTDEKSHLPKVIEEISSGMHKLANWVLWLLPIGLFAITYQFATQLTWTTMASLGQLAAVVFGATLIHGLLVLPTIVWLVSGMSPFTFIKRILQPLFTALLTSSSATTLPVSMIAAEKELGVDRAKASFILPLGATANMDGTALFEGIAAIYLAYMFGIDLGSTEIITVFLISMLSSIGAPGMPSGSMAGMQLVLLAVGIPLEAIALLLLIERPLDTFRTAVNVEGDLAGCLVVEHFITGKEKAAA